MCRKQNNENEGIACPSVHPTGATIGLTLFRRRSNWFVSRSLRVNFTSPDLDTWEVRGMLFCAIDFASVLILDDDWLRLIKFTIPHDDWNIMYNLTFGLNINNLAKHAISERVFADHLELVISRWGQSLNGDFCAARRSHWESGPVTGPSLTIPEK